MEQQVTTAVAVMSYKDMREMATDVVKSGMFAMKTTEQALTLMSICQAEGLHPMQALKRYHIINGGRPSMRADAMLADFQRLGGRVKWIVRTDSECRAVFSHEQGGDVEVRWTLEMAKSAGLTRNPTWQQYPRQMLTARTISEGIRTCLPGVVAGIYTPEEEADMRASDRTLPTPPAPTATTAPSSPRTSRPAPQPAAQKPAPTQVVEAEYTPAETPEHPGEGKAPPAAPAEPEQAPEATQGELAEREMSENATGYNTEAIAALPAQAPSTLAEQRSVAKAIYAIIGADDAEALKADLSACASTGARVALLQKAIDELKGGF